MTLSPFSWHLLRSGELARATNATSHKLRRGLPALAHLIIRCDDGTERTECWTLKQAMLEAVEIMPGWKVREWNRRWKVKWMQRKIADQGKTLVDLSV